MSRAHIMCDSVQLHKNVISLIFYDHSGKSGGMAAKAFDHGRSTDLGSSMF